MEITEKVYWQATRDITDILSLMPDPLPFSTANIETNNGCWTTPCFRIGRRLRIYPVMAQCCSAAGRDGVVNEVTDERIQWVWEETQPELSIDAHNNVRAFGVNDKQYLFWNGLIAKLVYYVNGIAKGQY